MIRPDVDVTHAADFPAHANPVTAVILWRDDPHLVETLRCIRPYVREIIIVNTNPGSLSSHNAGLAGEAAAALFDHPAWDASATIIHCPECNDADGNIADFSVARQRGFDAAHAPWILWLDSDDVIRGLDRLPEVIAEAERAQTAAGKPVRVVAAYEYAYDDQGECVILHGRERIMSNVRGAWRWDRPVHEACVAAPGQPWHDIKTDLLVWQHRSQPGRNTHTRNLRILRRYADEQGRAGIVDPRTLFDLGAECEIAGLSDEADVHFRAYLDVSDQEDEKAVACIHLSNLALQRAWKTPETGFQTDPVDALSWAERAVRYSGRFDDFFAVARIQYVTAGLRNEPERLEQAILFAEAALQSKVLGHHPASPKDRRRGVYELLVDCYTQRNDWKRAAGWLKPLLEARPTDPYLLLKQRELDVELAWLADTNGETDDDRLDIAFAFGHVPRTFSMDALFETARRMAKAGHRVRVYCDCQSEGLFDGIEVRNADNVRTLVHCDVLIAWGDATVLDPDVLGVDTKVRAVWADDTRIANLDYLRAFYVDRVFAECEWQRAKICENHHLQHEKVEVIETHLYGDKRGFGRIELETALSVLIEQAPQAEAALRSSTLPRVVDATATP